MVLRAAPCSQTKRISGMSFIFLLLVVGSVQEKVKAIICMGKDNKKIHDAFAAIGGIIVDTSSAEEAVQAAFHLAAKGDVVLLSPACASFDLFKNYEDRGNQFKKAVREL